MLGNLISMFMGLASYGKEKAEEITAELMEKGDLQREEIRKMIEIFIERGETERNIYISRVLENIENMKGKIVTKNDIDSIEKKLDYLNRKYTNE